jgi:hypothetical protein
LYYSGKQLYDSTLVPTTLKAAERLNCCGEFLFTSDFRENYARVTNDCNGKIGLFQHELRR